MQPYFKFSTQTAGEAARRVLLAGGIPAVLRRNAQSRPGEGCSFALYVGGDMNRAMRLLKRAGITAFVIRGGRDAP